MVISLLLNRRLLNESKSAHNSKLLARDEMIDKLLECLTGLLPEQDASEPAPAEDAPAPEVAKQEAQYQHE